MTRAVFLDRDGVINRAVVREGRPYPPASVAELEYLPRVAEALEKLRRAGFRLIIVTNQPDVATGLQQRAVVETMHEQIHRELQVDDIKVCYHIDQDHCSCRKPAPGMLLQAASTWSIDLADSYMIGDRWRDVAAGKAAGCTTILVRSDYNEQQAQDPDAIVESLLEASELILAGQI
jgi:D-glycero-D-manno-heptose 1,7-bisphosphate phosphatase